ncbi:DNA cytosine methyltransferase [Clostridiales bacterium]|nr:DNA cytosine methyltransferase [Clostridiales bacterium]
MSKEVFRLGELFCGPGGIACGAHKAVSDDGKLSITHAWANDFDQDTCDTYAKNICNGDSSTVYCMDVRKLDINKLGSIDAFAYGFPCNSFSNVGEHEGLGNEKFGQLYTYGIEVLKKFQPKWFLAENVSGIRSAGDGDHFKVILQDMENAGYKLVTHMYKFEQYGIPQTRHRIIIVGIRNDLDAQGIKFKVPSPEPYKNIDVTARTALANIPKDASNNEVRPLQEKVKRRLSYIKPGQNIWQAENLPPELEIKTRTRISQIYRKLDPDKPSYTVTAAGGGGTFMYHWSDEQRELTNRERARIQTFPDDFEFVGKYSSVRKQIGMAVPPKGAEIIFKAVLNTFANIDYPYIEPSLT